MGDFLPQTPMFCADESRPCDQGRFTPDNHGFRGRVSLLVMNSVSSCDGFVYELTLASQTACARLDLQLIATTT